MPRAGPEDQSLSVCAACTADPELTPSIVAPTTLGVAIGSPGGGAEGEAWAVSERLPKHYARPEGGPPPDPWREGAGAAPALGGATVTLVPGGDPPAAAAIAFTARCFAAPVGDGR